jgi:hypothetical protein
MGHTNGVVTLFGDTRFVDEETAIVGVTEPARDEALVLSKHGNTRPGALGKKGLQPTNRDTQGQRDGFARFARKRIEQTLEVTRHPSVLITTGKAAFEELNIALQVREQGFDIAHGQVAGRQWAGRCYNGVVHGCFPQSR